MLLAQSSGDLVDFGNRRPHIAFSPVGRPISVLFEDHAADERVLACRMLKRLGKCRMAGRQTLERIDYFVIELMGFLVSQYPCFGAKTIGNPPIFSTHQK